MNGYLLKKASTASPLIFFMADETGHITGVTGLTPVVTISKNGGAFGTPAGAVTEIGGGYYKVAGNATDTETAGPLILHATGAAADPANVVYTVEDPALPAAPANWLDAAAVKADAVTKIQAGITTAVWAYSDKELTPLPDAPVFNPVFTRCTATVLDGEVPVDDSDFVFQLHLNTTSVLLKQLYEVTLTAHSNAQGVLEDDDGNAYIELQRTDHITPAGSYWTVTNSDLGLDAVPFFLTGDTFDLLTLV